MAMLHWEKEHFLPVFTEKRALFQHILRDAKSTKCELKEHLWERARLGWKASFPEPPWEGATASTILTDVFFFFFFFTIFT